MEETIKFYRERKTNIAQLKTDIKKQIPKNTIKLKQL